MFDYGTLQSTECLSPEIDIYAYSPSEGELVRRANAMLDSGAVMTCVPKWVIDRLGPLTYSSVRVRLANGELRDAITAVIRIRVASHDIPNRIEVVIIDKEYALIGRDILNRYRVMLDGPEERWSIEFT